MGNNISLITPEFRLSFVNLVVPKPYMENGKPRGEPYFSLEMLFDPEDMKSFKRWDEDAQALVDVDVTRICVEAAKIAWPGINVQEEFKVGKNWPIHDGDTHADQKEAAGKKNVDHYRGIKMIKAKTSQEIPPRLYIMENGKRTQLAQTIEVDANRAKQLFAGGNYAYAELSCAGVVSGNNKYITFYVNSVVFTREGDRLGGSSLMDRFEGYKSQTTDYDPTDGMDGDLDDEIPF